MYDAVSPKENPWRGSLWLFQHGKQPTSGRLQPQLERGVPQL
jgi:hypothetical protein